MSLPKLGGEAKGNWIEALMSHSPVPLIKPAPEAERKGGGTRADWIHALQFTWRHSHLPPPSRPTPSACPRTTIDAQAYHGSQSLLYRRGSEEWRM